MYKKICITNRSLCDVDFFEKIKRVASWNVSAIILREKDLKEDEYENLAKEVIKICNEYNTLCILHNFIDVAIKLNHKAIHLPFEKLKDMTDEQKKHFDIIGTSTHSLDDALYAKEKNCTYITAGHIFETDCKKGLKGRGLDFLSTICTNTSIPVYAIGGIDKDNIDLCLKAGADGICMMSTYMKAYNNPL